MVKESGLYRRIGGGAIAALLFSGFLLVMTLVAVPVEAFASTGFKDVNASTPHADDIIWLADNAITTGFDDGTFRGTDTVKRQDMAAFLRRLARLMGDESAEEDKTYPIKFTDVNSSTPHAQDIAWLASTGITMGFEDNTFRGMDTVKRQDMAAFLRRLAARLKVGYAETWDWAETYFTDVNSKTPHVKDIAWLASSGVTTGFEDNTFRGMNEVIRQDMAAFLHRVSVLRPDDYVTPADEIYVSITDDGVLWLSSFGFMGSEDRVISWLGLGTDEWFRLTKQYSDSIRTVFVDGPISAPTDSGNLFSNLTWVEGMNLRSLNTSGVTNMSGMFKGCYRLEHILAWNFDTSSVVNMASMFSGCENLISLDFSVDGKFFLDTSHVVDMNSMFEGCRSLSSLSLAGFDTALVTNMAQMFADCTRLRSLNLSGMDTSSVTYMPGMFKGCSSLTTLDVSMFDTSRVLDMNSMFSNCTALTSLDLSSFNVESVKNMNSMFRGCRSLMRAEGLDHWILRPSCTAIGMFTDCPATPPKWYN